MRSFFSGIAVLALCSFICACSNKGDQGSKDTSGISGKSDSEGTPCAEQGGACVSVPEECGEDTTPASDLCGTSRSNTCCLPAIPCVAQGGTCVSVPEECGEGTEASPASDLCGTSRSNTCCLPSTPCTQQGGWCMSLPEECPDGTRPLYDLCGNSRSNTCCMPPY
jgi:hypothetical protein